MIIASRSPNKRENNVVSSLLVSFLVREPVSSERFLFVFLGHDAGLLDSDSSVTVSMVWSLCTGYPYDCAIHSI